MRSFLEQLPKAELHVHLEGTLEPSLLLELARRNNIQLPFHTVEDVLAAYDFDDLSSFLAIYYPAMDVLRTEADFYDLAYQYFERAAKQNVIYCEPFFDPQAHTIRGVDFDTVIKGISQAQKDAREFLGLDSNLIMCILRDHSAESAAELLKIAQPHFGKLIGLGLDSDEKDNPPSKFSDTFTEARDAGLKLTMHCDVNQKDIHDHIRECLDVIQVDRIDHGINILEREDLIEDVKARNLGLTICPLSNEFVVQNLTGGEIRQFLELGIKATVNSDDPAYFIGYMNENLVALAERAGFSRDELVQLTRNAFEISWADKQSKANYLEKLDTYEASA